MPLDSEVALFIYQTELFVETLYEQPLVEPQVLHFRQVPFRTSVKLPHSEHGSPS